MRVDVAELCGFAAASCCCTPVPAVSSGEGRRHSPPEADLQRNAELAQRRIQVQINSVLHAFLSFFLCQDNAA